VMSDNEVSVASQSESALGIWVGFANSPTEYFDIVVFGISFELVVDYPIIQVDDRCTS
jgi:hypothetical protein